MNHFSIGNLDAISKHIISLQKKLVYIAGSSASGKSYCADLISKDLQSKGKRVISISSDNYYSNQTKLHYLLYGTFDHPHLIEYDLLADNIGELLKTGATNIPEYSFKEGRRIGSHPLNDSFDIIIVE
jgi:uridine kinase